MAFALVIYRGTLKALVSLLLASDPVNSWFVAQLAPRVGRKNNEKKNLKKKYEKDCPVALDARFYNYNHP